jgi:hypothetical protein
MVEREAVARVRREIKVSGRINNLSVIHGVIFVGVYLTAITVLQKVAYWLMGLAIETTNELFIIELVIALTGLLFVATGLFFRNRSLIQRQKLLHLAQSVSSNELLGLATDQNSADWVAWILRKRIGGANGVAAFVAAMHWKEGCEGVFEECRITELDQLAEVVDGAKKITVPWQFRLTYLIPLLTFILLGWSASRMWEWSSYERTALLFVTLFGLFAPCFIAPFFVPKKLKGLALKFDQLLGLLPLLVLERLVGAGVGRSSAELQRRVKSKNPGAREAMKRALLVRERSGVLRNR